MGTSKVNIRARVKRHSRILASHIQDQSFPAFFNKSLYNFLIFVIVFILPIYPVLGGFVHGNTGEFDRRDVDESNILVSYVAGEESTEAEEVQGGTFIDSNSPYLSVSSVIDNVRDTSGSNEVIEYVIKNGDSISSIAQKFNISNDSIYWANNLYTDKVIQPGQTLQLPPVSGVIHTVGSGDSISTIAQKYKVSEEQIRNQNDIDGNTIRKGAKLVVPGGIKSAPQAKPKSVLTAAPKRTPSTASSSSSSGYSFAKAAKSSYVNTNGKYNLVWRKPYSGAPGNCTWFVASHKNVNWRGNANQWIRNARAKGHATGSTPTLGSIVSLQGRGYNPYYGHVAIVVDITDTHLIVKDMNYRRLYEVTTRKIPRNDPAIRGYIYVD